LAGGAQSAPFQREAQPEGRPGSAQHAVEPGDQQRKLIEIDASLFEREAAGGARRGSAAAWVGSSQQEHRKRQRVVEHQALDVRGRSDGDERVAHREGSPETTLRRSGVSHERMFA
ncbi:MAG: hypothetical protein QOH15_3344, partial [Gaiellales bacterium]|nr:hypothetical protein [Gaiellales bacterium]